MLIKRILRVFLGITLVLATVILMLSALIMAQSVDPQQRDCPEHNYNFPDTLAGITFDLDSLRQLAGDGKGLPEGFELAALLAYSAYPELKEVKINMKLTPTGPPMQANIDIPRLLGPKKYRKYEITLNDAHGMWADPILLRNLPFDAQVGILAHELGHVAYYHRLSALQIAKWGIQYLRHEEFRATHERSTDLMPVYHGLGSQIYQYAYYVRRDPSCLQVYKNNKHFMDTYYMTDLEIKEVLAKYDGY